MLFFPRTSIEFQDLPRIIAVNHFYNKCEAERKNKFHVIIPVAEFFVSICSTPKFIAVRMMVYLVYSLQKMIPLKKVTFTKIG